MCECLIGPHRQKWGKQYRQSFETAVTDIETHYTHYKKVCLKILWLPEYETLKNLISASKPSLLITPVLPSELVVPDDRPLFAPLTVVIRLDSPPPFLLLLAESIEWKVTEVKVVHLPCQHAGQGVHSFLAAKTTISEWMEITRIYDDIL